MSDNDSLKGKNGKVRVMYVRKEEEQEQTRRPSSRSSADDRRGDQRSEGRSPWNTSGARGGDRADRASGEAARHARQDSPSRDDSGVRAATRRIRRGRPFTPAMTPPCRIMVGSAAKVRLIPNNYAASAPKKPVSTVKMPVRRCFATGRTRLSGPGLSKR